MIRLGHHLVAMAGCLALVACQRPASEKTPPPDGTPATAWTLEETMKVRSVHHLRISPDDRRVLFEVKTAVLSGDKGQYLSRIYMANADGTNEHPLTESASSATDAEWSPDGRWIACLAERPGDPPGPVIWLMPAAGGTPHVLVAVGNGAANLAWSPDGAKLAFTMPAAATDAQVNAEQHPGAPRVVNGSCGRKLQILPPVRGGQAAGPRANESRATARAARESRARPASW